MKSRLNNLKTARKTISEQERLRCPGMGLMGENFSEWAKITKVFQPCFPRNIMKKRREKFSNFDAWEGKIKLFFYLI